MLKGDLFGIKLFDRNFANIPDKNETLCLQLFQTGCCKDFLLHMYSIYPLFNPCSLSNVVVGSGISFASDVITSVVLIGLLRIKSDLT